MEEGSSSGSQPVVIEENYGDYRNYSDMRVHFSAAHCNYNSCIGIVSDACDYMKKLLQSWRENDWHDKEFFLRLNKKKCEDLLTFLDRAKANYHSNTCDIAAREFLTAVKRAKNLVEESSHNRWLLKAVELWECSEHFLEVSLDLCWSSHLMSLGVDRNSREQEWQVENEQELLLNSWRPIAQARGCDETKLDAMVKATLSGSALREGCAKHQLALLLKDRLKDQSSPQSSWHPPMLTSFNFSIKSRFNLLSRSSSRGGADVVVLRFPWVYKKQFALKLRHPNSNVEKSFEEEFKVLDKYRSPYIVAVVGYWDLKPRWPWPQNVTLCPFLFMEALEFDLEGLICKYRELRQGMQGGFSPLETIKLMLPVARALRFLHDHDVAHRDIKLQNIMCSNAMGNFDDATVKLIDFGEAKVGVSNIPENDNLWPAGTNGYKDPEMWEPDLRHGSSTGRGTTKWIKKRRGYDLLRADVFSFAMVFVHLLTWVSPWGKIGPDLQAKLNENERPPLPNELPDYVSFIVECCWCKDPIARPTFTDICSMLQNAKLLLLDGNFFGERDDLFSYTDGDCVERSIADREFLC